MDTPIDAYIASYFGDERPGITKDVAFNRKSFSPNQPENPDQGNIYTGLDGLRVELVQDYDDDDLRRVCSFAINATRGIDPENPPEPVDWEEMLKGGLQTALEDFRIAFAVYGMSRTGTHQLVRTRLAAFHQQSQRAHYYGDFPSVRMPESFLDKKVNNPELEKARNPLERIQTFPQKYNIAEEYAKLAEHAAWFYRLACEADISYQDARFGLLEGTTNFILWEGSLREFFNTYAYRACRLFQWEIQYVFHQMRERLLETHPYLEPYIKISCEKTKGTLDGGPGEHHCTFQGWEQIEGQCDFEYARETNRAFRSERHGIFKK
jgi:thymidylate synthase (FAD)